ncbi:unnamed protein product [Toxocara canis]|uniref:RRM domain-containing protein n=1 Tax=Toxocara canis TaxID=6265 RepID=A0A183UC36_TOXCA|nr:unnamed protein product [Toxocara canis]
MYALRCWGGAYFCKKDLRSFAKIPSRSADRKQPIRYADDLHRWDFFEDHVGPCSFDFIKLSQDQLKLFVAVRFETRDAAKECMHKYKDGEVLGYPVELTWFKDIRRYMSYQQSQGCFLRVLLSRELWS